MGRFQIQACLLIVSQAQGEQPVVPAPPSLLPRRNRECRSCGGLCSGNEEAAGVRSAWNSMIPSTHSSAKKNLYTVGVPSPPAPNLWVSLGVPRFTHSWDVSMGSPVLQSRNPSSEEPTLPHAKGFWTVLALANQVRINQCRLSHIRGQLQQGIQAGESLQHKPSHKCWINGE